MMVTAWHLDRPLSSSEKFLAADNFGIGALLSRYLGRKNHTFVMAEYEQQNMPYWSYNVKLKDALLQEGYMHPVLSDRGKNVFLYGGISALGEMIMVRCSKLTIAISWPRMCSTCIHLIVIRPPDDWCICGGLFLVRFSSWFFVSTTSVRMARTNLHIRATKNVIDANDKFFHFTLCILPVLSA